MPVLGHALGVRTPLETFDDGVQRFLRGCWRALGAPVDGDGDTHRDLAIDPEGLLIATAACNHDDDLSAVADAFAAGQWRHLVERRLRVIGEDHGIDVREHIHKGRVLDDAFPQLAIVPNTVSWGWLRIGSACGAGVRSRLIGSLASGSREAWPTPRLADDLCVSDRATRRLGDDLAAIRAVRVRRSGWTLLQLRRDHPIADLAAPLPKIAWHPWRPLLRLIRAARSELLVAHQDPGVLFGSDGRSKVRRLVELAHEAQLWVLDGVTRESDPEVALAERLARAFGQLDGW